MLVHHRQRVIVRPHLAGAGNVLRSGHAPQQPVVQRFVRCQIGRLRLDQPLDDALIVGVVQKADAFAYRLPQAGQIARVVGEIVVVQRRLHVGVAGSDGQIAFPVGQLQDAGKANPLRLQRVAGNGRRERRGHNLNVVPQFRAGGGVAQRHLRARVLRVQRKVVLHLDGHPDVGMVAQILPHAGRIQHHRNAQPVQRGGRPDARQHQQLGRGDGAGAEDDFGAGDGELFAAAFHLGAHGPRPPVGAGFEQDAMHRYIGLDGEVHPVAGGAEVGQRSAHPHAVGVVHRDRPHAARLRVVHIGVMRMPGRHSGGVERPLRRQPGFLGEPPHRNMPVGVVEVVGAEVHIRLQLAEIGQAVDEFPLVIAQGGPGVIVFRHAPQ